MGKCRRIGLILLFLVMGAAAMLYLNFFTHSDGAIRYLDWSGCYVVEVDGGQTPFDLGTGVPELEVGQAYRFTAALPDDVVNGEYLIFENTGMDLTVSINGQEIYASTSVLPEGNTNLGQVQLPLRSGAGQVLTMDCVILAENVGVFPPLLRLSTDPTDTQGAMAAANHYGIPAGISALVWLLAWGLFLLGLANRRPDWSLLPLSITAAALTLYYPAQEGGGYFLPPALSDLFTWPGWKWIILLSLVVFLALHRSGAFWRSLGKITAWSAGLLLCAYLLSHFLGGQLAFYLETQISLAFQGQYFTGLSYWFTLWLTTVCTCLAALSLVHSIYAAEARVQALQLKNQAVMENYQALLEKNSETLRLRHEWKHQLLSLRLLQEKGDLEGLGARLGELDDELDRLTPRLYTSHPAINTILQKAAAQAEGLGVAFTCQAEVPEELDIDERDLCTLLVNLLDNALEAAAQVQPPKDREVLCRIRYAQGFLAIHCENTYCGTVRLDEAGQLITTKKKGEGHGFGLSQMRVVAEKYNSVLDIRYDQDRFTVQTALAL